MVKILSFCLYLWVVCSFLLSPFSLVPFRGLRAQPPKAGRLPAGQRGRHDATRQLARRLTHVLQGRLAAPHRFRRPVRVVVPVRRCGPRGHTLVSSCAFALSASSRAPTPPQTGAKNGWTGITGVCFLGAETDCTKRLDPHSLEQGSKVEGVRAGGRRVPHPSLTPLLDLEGGESGPPHLPRGWS